MPPAEDGGSVGGPSAQDGGPGAAPASDTRRPSGRLSADVAPELLEALEDARDMGFLGPAPVTDVVAHARAFVPPVAQASAILDLGSGAGIPGLVVAAEHPMASVILLDSSQRRTDWLRRVVSRLGWSDRVRVVQGRAETLGHEPGWRCSQDAVVARGFAPPLVTAECAAAFLVVGGRLVVSEPPVLAPDRWPVDRLEELGLVALDWADATVAVMAQTRPCPDAVPRGRVVRGHTS